MSTPLPTLGPLLAAITQAEELSRDISARQALLAPAPLRRTLQQQSWQEAAHATVFRSALQCLPGRFSCPPAVRAALDDYAHRLHADLDRGSLADSLIGLQGTLEGFAAVALQPPPGTLARRADALVPLWSFILHQEQGHERLGGVWSPRLEPDCAARLRCADDYRLLALSLLEAGLGELECLHQHSGYFRRRVGQQLDAARMQLAGGDPSAATAPAPSLRRPC